MRVPSAPHILAKSLFGAAILALPLVLAAQESAPPPGTSDPPPSTAPAPAAEGEPTVGRMAPEQAEIAREQLDSLSGIVGEIQLSKFASLAAKFHDAADGGRAAALLFANCKRDVDYEWDDRTRREAADWVDRSENWLYSGPHTAALQVQLRYLALSLRLAAMRLRPIEEQDFSSFFDPLMDHINSVVALRAPPNSRDFTTEGGGKGKRIPFQTNLKGTVFVQRFDLQLALDGLEDWEMNPFDVGGIFGKSILPLLRVEAPERLAAAWQRRIEAEKTIAERKEGKAEFNFNRITLPELTWGALKDRFYADPSATNAASLIAHINAYKSEHPAAGDWVREATALFYPEAETETEPAPEPNSNPFEGMKLGE